MAIMNKWEEDHDFYFLMLRTLKVLAALYSFPCSSITEFLPPGLEPFALSLHPPTQSRTSPAMMFFSPALIPQQLVYHANTPAWTLSFNTRITASARMTASLSSLPCTFFPPDQKNVLPSTETYMCVHDCVRAPCWRQVLLEGTDGIRNYW